MPSDKPWFQEGLKRLRAGERVNFSTGIDGRMTYGYGQLDQFGFWEHPVPFEDLPQAQRDMVLKFETKKDGD